jgi:hypothetical protein
MTDFKNDLKDLFRKEVKLIKHPSQNKSIIIDENELDTCLELLSNILDHHIPDSSFERLSSDFRIHFYKIKNWHEDEMPNAIINLATLFETYVRKIAYIKFGDNELFYGNNDHKGIIKSSLHDLLESSLSNKHDERNKEIRIPFPSKLVPDNSISIAVLNYLRENIRNDIHNASSYNREKILINYNIVLVSYYIVTLHNLTAIRHYFFKEIKYLKAITDEKVLSTLSSQYTNLVGFCHSVSDGILQEHDDDKIADLVENWTKFDSFEIDYHNAEEDSDDQNIVRDDILRLAKYFSRAYLLGEPGSGKTTTIKKIFFDNAKGLINGDPDSKFPIYIKGSSYSLARDFMSLIRISIDDLDFEELISKYKVILLIDGLNEITQNIKKSATQELSFILEKHKTIDVLISTRKSGFRNDLGLSFFEIEKLSDDLIFETLENKIKSKSKWIWENLQKNRDLLQMANNPLMLQMIIAVLDKKNEFPRNKGLLYNLFVDVSFERSNIITSLNVETKKEIISSLAFSMFEKGQIKKIKKEKLKNYLHEIFHSRGIHIDINDFVDELIESSLIISIGDSLEFNHETYQEYFISLEIKKRFLIYGKVDSYISDERWERSYIMCADLFKEKSDFLNYFNHLLIGEKSDSTFKVTDFENSNVNTKVYVPCKIAFNYSEIEYFGITCENYLNNLIAIWILNRNSPTNNSTFDEIVRSVAALARPQLVFKVFNNINFLEALFLYNPINSKNGINNEISVLNNSLSWRASQFIMSCSDSFVVFQVLKCLPEKYHAHTRWLSEKLHASLVKFISELRNMISIEELKKLYEKTSDYGLLKEIGMSDIKFYYINHQRHSISQKKCISFIVNYSKSSEIGKEILFSILQDSAVTNDNRLMILDKYITKGVFLDELLDVLATLKSNNDSLLDDEDFKRILQTVPLNILKKYNLGSIFRTPSINVHSLDFDKAFIEGDFIFIKPITDKTCFPYLEYQGSHFTSYDVVYGSYFALAFRCYVDSNLLIKVKEDISLFENSQIRVIDYLSQSLFYVNIQKIYTDSIQKNSVIVQISKAEYLKLKDLKLNQIVLSNGIKLKIHESFETQSRELLFKIEKAKLGLEKETYQFDFYDIELDYLRPFAYHKQSMLSDARILKILEYKVSDVSVAKFIKSIGIASYFKILENDVPKGIIIRALFNGECFIYNLYKKKILLYKELDPEKYGQYKNGVCVNIESDNSLQITSSKTLPQKLFDDGIIVKYNTDGNKREGFIRGKEKYDYYFNEYFIETGNLFNKCYVKYIKGVNYRFGSTKPSPMALCIRFDDTKHTIAKLLRFETFNGETGDVVYIDLEDIKSNEKLYTKNRFAHSISNFNQPFQVGQHFIYSKGIKQGIIGKTYVRLDYYLDSDIFLDQ